MNKMGDNTRQEGSIQYYYNKTTYDLLFHVQIGQLIPKLINHLPSHYDVHMHNPQTDAYTQDIKPVTSKSKQINSQ